MAEFVFKHLYELMADDYRPTTQTSRQMPNLNSHHQTTTTTTTTTNPHLTTNQTNSNTQQTNLNLNNRNLSQTQNTNLNSQYLQTNRQQQTPDPNDALISFLVNNHLPELAAETVIELLVLSALLACAWIAATIAQVHCNQTTTTNKLVNCPLAFNCQQQQTNHASSHKTISASF